MKKLFYLILICAVMACEAVLDIDDPQNEIGSSNIFEDNAMATSAVRGIYAEMASTPYFSNGGIALLTGLSGDEFIPMGEDYTEFYTTGLKPDEPRLKEYLWSPGYRYIYNANAAIDGLNHSNGVGVELRRQLVGESLFIRAFCHFYLTNLFGPVPLLVNKDVDRNAQVTRTIRNVVYDTIVTDLVKARNLLSDDLFAYSDTEQGRIRPTTWAASALLARVYLYQGRWEQAELEATRVIESTDLFSLENVSGTFKVTSREAIWQLKSVTPGMGCWDAALFMPASDLLSVALRSGILDAFEPDDERRTAWINGIIIGPDIFYYPAKYKSQYSPLEEYHIELRLSELYLIRAEARVWLNDLEGAFADLDVIRERAGLPPLVRFGDSKGLLDAITKERLTELFAESGHRWFDLIRLNHANVVFGALSNRSWQGTDMLYPIPQSEIDANRNLAPQNAGY